MYNRAAFAAQLEKMHIPAQKLEETTRIEYLPIPIKPIVAIGAGMLVTTQLVLRYRFGNV